MSGLSICGARVITPGKDLGVTTVSLEGGRIVAVGAPAPALGETIDATGLTRPESDLAELCRCVERYKASHGDAEAQSEAEDLRASASLRENSSPGATCLGVHLEGPFFNPAMAGAQNPAYLMKPDAAMVKRLDSISKVVKVSLAPELEGAAACIRELTAAGIVVSLGIPDRGEIAPGKIADLTLVDADLNPVMTIVNGRLLWAKEGTR